MFSSCLDQRSYPFNCSDYIFIYVQQQIPPVSLSSSLDLWQVILPFIPSFVLFSLSETNLSVLVCVQHNSLCPSTWTQVRSSFTWSLRSSIECFLLLDLHILERIDEHRTWSPFDVLCWLILHCTIKQNNLSLLLDFDDAPCLVFYQLSPFRLPTTSSQRLLYDSTGIQPYSWWHNTVSLSCLWYSYPQSSPSLWYLSACSSPTQPHLHYHYPILPIEDPDNIDLTIDDPNEKHIVPPYTTSHLWPDLSTDIAQLPT